MGRWTDGQWSIQAILIEWEDPCCCNTYDQSKQLINLTKTPITGEPGRKRGAMRRPGCSPTRSIGRIRSSGAGVVQQASESLQRAAGGVGSWRCGRLEVLLQRAAGGRAGAAAGWRCMRDGKEPRGCRGGRLEVRAPMLLQRGHRGSTTARPQGTTGRSCEAVGAATAEGRPGGGKTTIRTISFSN